MIGELLRALDLGRAERVRTASVQVERADPRAIGDQRQREAGADAERYRLPGKARPPAVAGHVVDAHLLAAAHGVQARPVARSVLHVVRLRRQRIGAGRGGRRAAILAERHPAAQPVCHRPGG